MALGDVDRLRILIGEVIPSDGTEADTMFTDAQIQDFLDRSSTLGLGLTKAAVYGWEAKAANYSNLVTVAEGNSSRNMSDLYKAALAMVKTYEGQVIHPQDDLNLDGRVGRVNIGTISRIRQRR